MNQTHQKLEILQSIVELAVRSTAGYDLLSNEYYTPDKHPTCANFTSLHLHTSDILRRWIKPGHRYLEVGCGNGRLDLIANRSRVVLTDLSEGMLMHARKRTRGLVLCRRMNAFEPDFPDESFDGVGAFLADSYNHPSFYRAIRKVIKPGGLLFLTLPNHIWATALRSSLNFPSHETVFIVGGEQRVPIPSITRLAPDQAELLSNLGFDVVLSTTLNLNSVATPSEHVRIAGEALGLRSTSVPLLDLYLAIKDEA